MLHSYFMEQDKIFRILLATNHLILPVLVFKYSKPPIFGHQVLHKNYRTYELQFYMAITLDRHFPA